MSVPEWYPQSKFELLRVANAASGIGEEAVILSGGHNFSVKADLELEVREVLPKRWYEEVESRAAAYEYTY